MYCPNCAAHNQDQTKFCRSCGLDLRAVGAALKAQSTPSSEEIDGEGNDPKWLIRQSEGVHRVAQGSLLTLTSVLLGVALAFFSYKRDWFILWFIFCGWLAIWGAYELGTGIGSLIQSRMMRRRMEQLFDRTISPQPPYLANPVASAASVDTQKIPELPRTEAGQETSAPPSVTEHTTSPLPAPGSRP